MKLETTGDILELMDVYVFSAAVGTAMELSLFWLLDEKPLPASTISQSLNIPLNRCHIWLLILCQLGLLEHNSGDFALTPFTREAVLDAQSQNTWAFQAREDRETALFVQDLALHISNPRSIREVMNLTQTDYFQKIQEDPDYAARFTRKLCEIHGSLATKIANMLDLRGVKSLLDLGGGSGVVSFALLRKKHDLTSVVVDIYNVCQAGREIAKENKLENRISYIALDFLQNDIPTGFDMVMHCDLGLLSEVLFRKVYDALNPGGRFVIVDKFAPSRTAPPPSRLSSAFLDSLVNPSQIIDFTTEEVVQAQLEQVGFRESHIKSVPHEDDLPWNMDWTILETKK